MSHLLDVSPSQLAMEVSHANLTNWRDEEMSSYFEKCVKCATVEVIDSPQR